MHSGHKEGKSLWYEGWLRLKKNKVAVASGLVLIFLCLIAILAYQISPYPFDEQFMDRILQSPDMRHWLGTDSLGRDMLSRLIHGARMSMAVGIITAILSLIVGAVYGAIAGWWGGRVDAV